MKKSGAVGAPDKWLLDRSGSAGQHLPIGARQLDDASAKTLKIAGAVIVLDLAGEPRHGPLQAVAGHFAAADQMPQQSATLALGQLVPLREHLDDFGRVASDQVIPRSSRLRDDAVDDAPVHRGAHDVAHLCPHRRVLETLGVVRPILVDLVVRALRLAHVDLAVALATERREVAALALPQARIDADRTVSRLAVTDGDRADDAPQEYRVALSHDDALGHRQLAIQPRTQRLDIHAPLRQLARHNLRAGLLQLRQDRLGHVVIVQRAEAVALDRPHAAVERAHHRLLRLALE